MKRNRIACVVPNLNGMRTLGKALDSLLAQHLPKDVELSVIVVDNGSPDGSARLVEERYPRVQLIKRDKNYGFTGGVNPGIQSAIDQNFAYIALLNNDAVAATDWLKHLYTYMEAHPHVGIATGKLLTADRQAFDSTGEFYTTWGLTFPRGRGQPASTVYDDDTEVFGASGGASLYRTDLFRQIGLFDNDFFAYYEDMDISFRAQLYGWKVAYVPAAEVYHKIGQTTKRLIKGFTTYQTLKNLPWLLWKNVPGRYLFLILPRFTLAYVLFLASAVARGQGGIALKGFLYAWLLLPKKLVERRRIQRSRRVQPSYIWGKLYHDLPPDAARLRRLRSVFFKHKANKGTV